MHEVCEAVVRGPMDDAGSLGWGERWRIVGAAADGPDPTVQQEAARIGGREAWSA